VEIISPKLAQAGAAHWRGDRGWSIDHGCAARMAWRAGARWRSGLFDLRTMPRPGC